MSIAEKLTQVAENVPKVYKAGQSSMVDESKLIPKTVSGSYISVDDVSEIPHEVKCNISGVDNPESVSVTRCGKNLCPINDRTFTTSMWKEFNPPLPAGTYTMSGKFATEHPDNKFMVLFQNADRANATNAHLLFDVSDNGQYSRSFIAYEPISWIFWYAADNYGNAYNYKASIANFQLTRGTTVLPYEPYNGQTLTPATDGTIEGMTSVPPYMNIFADTEGVNIEAKYNKSYGIQIERERFYNDFKQGKINVSISFEWLALNKANTTSVINALSTTATGQTLTLKLSAVNTAFETSAGAGDGSTSAEFAALVATKTNWTITMV